MFIKILKIFGLLFVGLFTAGIIYPVIHEFSHVLTAVIVGAEVIDINFFPVSNIICDVSEVGTSGAVLIGFGGMVLPFLSSLIFNFKKFWLWYANVIIRMISMVSFTMSVVSVILYVSGYPIPNDDITQILLMWEKGAIPCLFITAFLTVLAFMCFTAQKPFYKCVDYLTSKVNMYKKCG